MKEYSLHPEYLIKKGITIGNYVYFEEDCPIILKTYAENQGVDPNELFKQCEFSVKNWYPEYLDTTIDL